MTNKYAVLNDRLLPRNVAELLLSEGTGKLSVSAEVTVAASDVSDPSCLAELLIDALRKGIGHSWTAEGISEMIMKMMQNNDVSDEKIKVKLIQGDNPFLFACFACR